MGPKLKIFGAAVAVLVSAVVASAMRQGDAEASASTAATATSASEPSGYATMLGKLDARIESLQDRAETRPDDWLTRQHLGLALLERASLTHDVDDYAWLSRVLDEAFAIAPEGSGPMLLAARFDFAVHRLDAAESWLDEIDRRPLRKRDELIASHMLRAQIAMQRGEYEAALAGLSEVAAVAPGSATAELALYHAKTGSPERADALLVEALSRTNKHDARRRAWTMVQRGLVAMDRGAHLQALRRFEDADAELSGWWLVQEHKADAYDRLGEHARAIEILELLVQEHGMPQHIDALATAREHAGEDARELVAEASEKWTDVSERWPEAAMGHALEHELRFGDPKRAVELAESNHAARPGGDAELALARAYLGAGRAKDAVAVVQRTLVTPYRTAGLHRVAADAYAAAGDEDAAAQQLAFCFAMNPSCEQASHTH